MPTPLQIILDPISLGVLALYAAMMAWEALAPARRLPAIRGWHLRALICFTVYFFLSSYLPLWWDQYLLPYQLFDLSGIGAFPGLLVGLLVYNALLYGWHRSMHASNLLWRTFHQMHHSAERIDVFGAFYFSPLDMIGFTLVGSLALTLIVGLSPEAVTLFLFSAMFLAMFQHANVKTPRWIGYFVQRPESHTVHHGRGLHRLNYADLPVFDILFGTFKNPEGYEMQNGFYDGASLRVADMLLFRDASSPRSGDGQLASGRAS
jgi:sterol desaturase/sphingolipid hydroxylase (fatty acid hydroxylase superfamily)